MKFHRLKFGSRLQEIPIWTRYVAKDVDGYWWAYRSKPEFGSWNGWYSNYYNRVEGVNRYPICQYEDGELAKESIYEVY